MPDIEQIAGSVPFPPGLFPWAWERVKNSEHAWLTCHCVLLMNRPEEVRGGFFYRPHFESMPTLNWDRKVRRDPNGRLPTCILGSPPTLSTSYFAPTGMQSAWA